MGAFSSSVGGQVFRNQRRHNHLYLRGPHPHKTMVWNHGLHPLRTMVLKSPSAPTSMVFSIAWCQGRDFQGPCFSGRAWFCDGGDHAGTGDHASFNTMQSPRITFHNFSGNSLFCVYFLHRGFQQDLEGPNLEKFQDRPPGLKFSSEIETDGIFKRD